MSMLVHDCEGIFMSSFSTDVTEFSYTYFCIIDKSEVHNNIENWVCYFVSREKGIHGTTQD